MAEATANAGKSTEEKAEITRANKQKLANLKDIKRANEARMTQLNKQYVQKDEQRHQLEEKQKKCKNEVDN